MVRVPLFTTSLESSPMAWGHERALVKLRAYACGGGGLRALKGALVSQAAAERHMQVLASHLDQLRIRDSEIRYAVIIALRRCEPSGDSCCQCRIPVPCLGQENAQVLNTTQ
jgi:hypothetical protein